MATHKTWIDLPLHGTARLDFDLASTPDKAWGSAPEDAPPSYAPAPVTFPASTTARLSADAASLNFTLVPGTSRSLSFTVSNSDRTHSATIAWRANAPAQFVAVPDSGTIEVAGGGSSTVTLRLTARADASSGLYDIPLAATAANGASLERLVSMVRIDRSGDVPRLAYIENRFDNTVTPFDPATNAIGPAIAVGTEPRDAALSADGRRLFVADRGEQAISVIDTTTQSATAKLKVGHSPNGVALAPDGRTLWLANYDDDTIQAIDTATLAVGKPISVGSHPRSITIAPDGRTLYVTDHGSGTISPVDLRTNSAGDAIAVGGSPRG